MEKSTGLSPKPLTTQKIDGQDNGDKAGANEKATERSVVKDCSGANLLNNSQNEGRGCLPCYYVHERCSLRDAPSIPCQRCKQKSLECIIFPGPDGPRDPNKGLTSPRPQKSKKREMEEVLKKPDLHPKGPRSRPEKGKEEA